MIRILTAAAVAAVIASPAAAQSTRVSLEGKSGAQVQADIAQAAKKVCTQAIVGATFPRDMYASCFKHAVKTANAQLGAQSQMAAAQN